MSFHESLFTPFIIHSSTVSFLVCILTCYICCHGNRIWTRETNHYVDAFFCHASLSSINFMTRKRVLWQEIGRVLSSWHEFHRYFIQLQSHAGPFDACSRLIWGWLVMTVNFSPWRYQYIYSNVHTSKYMLHLRNSQHYNHTYFLLIEFDCASIAFIVGVVKHQQKTVVNETALILALYASLEGLEHSVVSGYVGNPNVHFSAISQVKRLYELRSCEWIESYKFYHSHKWTLFTYVSGCWSFLESF